MKSYGLLFFNNDNDRIYDSHCPREWQSCVSPYDMKQPFVRTLDSWLNENQHHRNLNSNTHHHYDDIASTLAH